MQIIVSLSIIIMSMVVPIIICCIKELLTAEGGRGHATISKHLSNMLTENYLRVTILFHV